MSANDYDPLILAASQQNNLDPRLLRAVIGTESSFDPKAYNAQTGATGLGQQIPATAQAYGIDPRDPAQSIQGTARQLAENIGRYGNVDDAVRAYHGGTDPKNWGPKTQEYVSKVSQAFQQDEPKQGAPQLNDPIGQMLAGGSDQAQGQTQAHPQLNDPLGQMLAQGVSQAPQAPQAQAVPRGTASDQYRSTLSPEGQQRYDKLLSDLRSQANFIEAGPNPGMGDKLMGGAWRGINDAADFLMGGLGFVGNRLGVVSDQTMDDYMHAIKQLDTEYEQARQAATPQSVGGLVSGQKPEPGIDWGRIVGQGLAGGAATRGLEAMGAGGASLLGRTGLLGDLSPTSVFTQQAGETAAQAAKRAAIESKKWLPSSISETLESSRLGRVLQNAFTGGTSAAVASTQSDVPLETQAGIGAAVGTIATPIVGKIASAVASPFAKLLSKAAPQAAGDVSAAMEQAAPSIMNAVKKDAQGNVSIDASQLPPQVQQALKTGPLKDLTPEQQARAMTFEALGVKDYTLADVTRNAADAMAERNLAQNAKAGGAIRQADIAKNEQLTQAAQRAVDMTGQDPSDVHAIGQDIRAHLQSQYQAQTAKINAAYKAADEAAGNAPKVSTNPIANTLNGMRSKFLASAEGKGLLEGIRGRLQEFSGGVPKTPGKPLIVDTQGNPLLNEGDLPRNMTFQDSERFRQYLNDVSTPDNYPLIKSIKNAVDQAQDNAGSGNIYEQARNLRQQRSAMFEDQGGIQKILANTPGGDPRMPVDKIMDNMVFNKGNADQLSQLINQLNKGGQEGQDILNRLRATTMHQAIGNAISKVPGETGAGALSGTALKAQLDKIGAKKMATLFTPEQQNYIGALQRGAVDLTTSPPVRNAYNPSGTAGQAINALDMLAQMPNAGGSKIGSLIASGAQHLPGIGSIVKPVMELNAQANERAAAKIMQQRAALSAKPLETLNAAQQKAQQDRIRQAIAARLMGNPAALGGAVQPSQ